LKTQTNGRIGIDGFEIQGASLFFAMDNFVGTPHMSAHTDEGMSRMSLVASGVLAVLEGRKPEFPVPGARRPEA
jgi:phosphoglycerate dehydrogenase-like enzyme